MEVLHISCNMCTRDLPDTYALSPRALGIHIRQIPHAHVTTYTYTPYVTMSAAVSSLCRLEQSLQTYGPIKTL